MVNEPPLHPIAGKAQSPIWVVLPKGIHTRGERVCWMPAEFRKTINGQTYHVSAEQLQGLKGCELRPSTNQEWLQKGIRFEEVALYRKETQGPAAQLVVFRDHPHMGGAPFHTDHPKPTHIGKLEIRRVL